MGSSTPATDSAAADHSRFVQRIRRRYGDELGLLLPEPVPDGDDELDAVLDADAELLAELVDVDDGELLALRGC